MDRLLFILPHCSTGGMPQYVLKQIEAFREVFEIHVCEVSDYGHFEVQRNKIKELTYFYQLFGDKKGVISLIDQIRPTVIHFQEVPESFLSVEILAEVYKNRTYKTLVTSHSSLTRRKDFVFLPDRIVAVNKWQKQLFEQELLMSKPGFTDIDIWEYPIEDLKPKVPEKIDAKIKLDLTFQKYGLGKHILNVGLFTEGKNQAELFEVARENKNNWYHFVGNQAPNFRHYWKPLMENKPDNCIIWGEREDVDQFYKACDEFYFTSKFELNPICIKEALSYGLPVKMYKLHTYLDDYDNNPLVTYL